MKPIVLSERWVTVYRAEFGLLWQLPLSAGGSEDNGINLVILLNDVGNAYMLLCFLNVCNLHGEDDKNDIHNIVSLWIIKYYNVNS